MRAVIAHSLRAAATFNDATEPPVAVLWADPDREWEPVVRDLQEAVPVLVLGEHAPERAQGPAIWLRAALAAPEAVGLPAFLHARDARNPWVIYLPGISRGELNQPGDMAKELRPLADVVQRSTWWPGQASAPAWTPHSFLASKNGAALDLAGDAATREALTAVLGEVLRADADELRALGRLDAARLRALTMPDPVRLVLSWISDPAATRAGLADGEWATFTATCRGTFGFDPTKDTAISAASLLGARASAWGGAWDRFADNPARYPGIPSALDKARPQGDLFGGTDPHPESWPSWNREQEDFLRHDLARFAGVDDPAVAGEQLAALAAQHATRRDTVWAEVGEAPLARVMPRIAELARLTATPVPSGDILEFPSWYAKQDGSRVDRLAVEIMGAVRSQADRSAVLAALHSVYDPWVDDAARRFQQAAVGSNTGYAGATGLDVSPSTCVVFVDALRFDLAQRLQERFPAPDSSLGYRFAAFPTVTPTGQPAVAPVAAPWGAGPEFSAGDAQGRAVKGDTFRKALATAGVQFLDWKATETGDPTGIAWTQTNTIDALGHDHGHALAGMLEDQLDLVAERIRGLVAAGWGRVVVVTDHGFLLPAAPAAKVDLSLAVTEGDAARKPRVARLKGGAQRPAFPVLPWTWADDVDMVSAPGASAFEAGTLYVHGGMSPQECILPVLTVDAPGVDGAFGTALAAQIHAVRWTGQRCRIDFTPEGAQLTAEVRLNPGDAASAVGGPKAPTEAGEIKVLVDEEAASAGTSAFIVLLSADGVVVAQQQTTVGENL